jgi:hypothetical protein
MSKLKRKGNPNLKSNVKGDMFMLEPIEHFTAHSHPVSKTELSAEYAMAETLIDQAMKAYSGSERERKLPNAFAAIFDLLVAAEYYSTIRNSGWLLCAGESHRSKLAIYPFTNACPRCALQKEFAYSKSNKPESGQIGTFTTRLLAVLVDCLLSKRGFNEIELRLGKEPIDLILIDKTNKIVLLCEVKAAPLTTPPMCVDYAHRSLVSGHSKIGVLDFDPNTQYYIMIPYRSSGEQWSYDLVPITLSPSNKDRVYESLAEKFCVRQQFEDYIAFWNCRCLTSRRRDWGYEHNACVCNGTNKGDRTAKICGRTDHRYSTAIPHRIHCPKRRRRGNRNHRGNRRFENRSPRRRMAQCHLPGFGAYSICLCCSCRALLRYISGKQSSTVESCRGLALRVICPVLPK